MIKNMEPVSMAEAMEYVSEDKDNKETDVKGFIKKFTKVKPEDAKALRKAIEEIGSMKVRPEHISKIIDLMPESEEELNKVFVDSNLDEEDSKKILDAIKQVK